jgi:hypothetical protein
MIIITCNGSFSLVLAPAKGLVMSRVMEIGLQQSLLLFQRPLGVCQFALESLYLGVFPEL